MNRVVVVGGGPAGCIVARRLAIAGVQVVQFLGGLVPGHEGLSRRTVELLRQEGLDDLGDLLTGPVPRSGTWGAQREVAGEEWLVERDRLAQRLRAAAQRAGVCVRDEFVEEILGDYPNFRVLARSGAEVEASVVVDARGRRGPELHGPTLLAAGQRLELARAEAPSTAIHALTFGWCWRVTSGKTAWVQVAARPGDQRPEDWRDRAATEVPALATLLAGSVPVGELVARPAHARRSLQPSRLGLVAAGDAAVGMDPLSGQGVYEAIRSARVAVAAAGTLLEGGNPDLVGRFLRERDDALWARVVATAAAFYRENELSGPFWPRTAAAYEALAVPSAAVATRIERRPVLDGERIQEREVLVTATQPRGVWQVDGVPVVDLIHYIERAGDATPGAAAAELARPQAAILAAARWLREAGAWPVRASQVIAAGG